LILSGMDKAAFYQGFGVCPGRNTVQFQVDICQAKTFSSVETEAA